MAPNPKILIVGAGIAGLSMAVMLERAGMKDYLILERAAELRPMGSAIALSAMMLRCYEQLGIYDEIMAVAKPSVGNAFLDQDLHFLWNMKGFFLERRYGYFNVILSRADYHRILAGHVPADKVVYGKKVLSLVHTPEGATIGCSDNSVYQADIVIGADGAYSSVRQSLYKSIQIEAATAATATAAGISTGATPLSSRGSLLRSTSAISRLSSSSSSLSSISSISNSSNESRSPKSVHTTASNSSLPKRKRSDSSGHEEGPDHSSRQDRQPTVYRLPKSDSAPLRFDQHGIVGITAPLDPEKYPFLKDKGCQVMTILSNSGISTWLFPLTGNRIAWCIGGRNLISDSEKKAQANSGGSDLAPNFMSTEWSPEAADGILKLDYLRNQKSPYGGTIGDMFDQTEKGTAIRIMLEDKAFKTWYYKRTVLVGDACHKVIPFTGVGAVHAILDCIVLINALYDMPDGRDFTQADITKAFQAYYAQRFKHAAAAVRRSKQVSQLISGTGAVMNTIRKGVMRGNPDFLVTLAADRIFASRPILTFLEFVPDYGTRKSIPQPLGRRDREVLEQIREKERLAQLEIKQRLKDQKRLLKGVNQSSGQESDVAMTATAGGDGSFKGFIKNRASKILQTTSSILAPFSFRSPSSSSPLLDRAQVSHPETHVPPPSLARLQHRSSGASSFSTPSLHHLRTHSSAHVESIVMQTGPSSKTPRTEDRSQSLPLRHNPDQGSLHSDPYYYEQRGGQEQSPITGGGNLPWRRATMNGSPYRGYQNTTFASGRTGQAGGQIEEEEEYDDDDAMDLASLYSFSSRFTLPYDAEEIQQCLVNNPLMFPYCSTPLQTLGEPLDQHQHYHHHHHRYMGREGVHATLGWEPHGLFRRDRPNAIPHHWNTTNIYQDSQETTVNKKGVFGRTSTASLSSIWKTYRSSLPIPSAWLESTTIGTINDGEVGVAGYHDDLDYTTTGGSPRSLTVPLNQGLSGGSHLISEALTIDSIVDGARRASAMRFDHDNSTEVVEGDMVTCEGEVEEIEREVEMIGLGITTTATVDSTLSLPSTLSSSVSQPIHVFDHSRPPSV